MTERFLELSRVTLGVEEYGDLAFIHHPPLRRLFSISAHD